MLSHLATFAPHFPGCNLHFCIYADLGAITLASAILELKQRHYDEAHERAIAGVIHLIVALLSL